jgi:hypothetical protein
MSSASKHSQKTGRQLDKKTQKIAVDRADLPPVFPDRQSVAIPVHGRLPAIVVLRPQVPAG